MSLTEAWCRTYTQLVPDEEAERRQAEVASHVHEARAAGVPGRRLALEGALGALADLAWSDRVRRRRGLVPLALTPLVDAGLGAIVAGVLVLLSLALSMLPGERFGAHDPLAWFALAVAASGHVVALVRRLRR